MSKISMVENAKATACKPVGASNFVEAVISGKWRDKIKSIRRTYQMTMEQTGGDSKRASAAISELKRKLPAVMWAGEFSKRESNGLKEYSGLMVIDLDHLGPRLTKAKEKLSSDPHVFACFVSPSGNGLKAVFNVPSDIERHADAWATAAKRVKSLTGIDPDGSGKDIARLCFASHDASAYHNPNAVQLEIEPAPASGRRPQSEAGASIETKDVRREIAVELLGSVKWLNQWKGFCDCPGKAKHTNMNGDRDCQVNLDGAPTIYCFHGSCHDDVDRMNQQLRSRIGKEDSSRNESHERDEMVFERLKKLTPAEYDRCREKEAKQLGIRTTVLDKEVDNHRRKQATPTKGKTLIFDDPAPWPEQVKGGEVLNQAAQVFRQYVVLPDGAADALALWVAHAHAFDCFMVTPRLNLCSPEKGCGKTTLVDVVATLAPRAQRMENISTAAMFRLVENQQPTLLLDEVDTYLGRNDELRGMLNAGHRRGGKALRCEGDNHEVTAYQVFCPAVLAGIGALPNTLEDRSVVVRLARAKQGEVEKRFDSRQLKHEQLIHSKLARWGQDRSKNLGDSNPTLPESAFNRIADNWRPLFAIAEAAGSDWPERANKAYEALTAETGEQGGAEMLLSDIKTVLEGEANSDRISSACLAEALAKMEERPWAEYGRGLKPITPRQLARKLKPFGISSQQIRAGESNRKGYYTDDFAEAFDRYLPHLLPQTKQRNNN